MRIKVLDHLVPIEPRLVPPPSLDPLGLFGNVNSGAGPELCRPAILVRSLLANFIGSKDSILRHAFVGVIFAAAAWCWRTPASRAFPSCSKGVTLTIISAPCVRGIMHDEIVAHKLWQRRYGISNTSSFACSGSNALDDVPHRPIDERTDNSRPCQRHFARIKKRRPTGVKPQ